MPLSRAEIQKRYRERRKAKEGEEYLLSERTRQRRYYKPVSTLPGPERRLRNEKSNKRVKRHRQLKKRLENEEPESERDESGVQSTSGYSSQESSDRLIVRFPARRNGPRVRLANALRRANERLRNVIQENIQTKKKVKSLQKKIQRQNMLKPNGKDLTPRRKTDRFMKLHGLRGNKVRKELLFGNVVVHELQASLKKNKRKYKSGIYAAVAGNIVKKYRYITKLSKELHADRNLMSKIIKKGLDFTKHRRRRVMLRLSESVTKFLESEENSRMQPGKRDAVKCNKEKVQSRVLTDYMANLHLKYLAEHSDHKLSLATFCRMRPKHILPTSAMSRNVCLCTKHQNMSLKLQMFKKIGIDVPKNPEIFLENCTEVTKTQLPEKVCFTKWKRVTLENKKKKMKIVSETLDRDEFYDEWLKEVEAFKLHVHIMRTQYGQTRLLKQNLPNHEIVIHMDFAENYACKTADEIQSAYWNSTQVTLHPMVIYYKDSEDILQHQSYVAVSDTMSHSSGTVLAIIGKLFTKEIDLPKCNEIHHVHYWTDSPTSQYRNRFIFNTVDHEDVFGCSATWNYYESGHGKNVCDGLGGTVKRLADESVRSGKCTIQDADDFMKWAESSTMNVKFFFVTKEECDSISSQLQDVEFMPIKGTLQLHAVRVDIDGNFCSRQVSCYCQECLNGGVCDTWTSHNIKCNNKHEPTQSENITMSVSSSLEYGIGEYIATVYDGEWYPAKITQVDEEDGEIEVSFMEKKKALFQWPNKNDLLWVDKSQILCKIAPPTASGKSRRMFKISQSDHNRIETRFLEL